MSINLWCCKKCDRDFETERNSLPGTIYEPPKCPHCGSDEVEWVGFTTKFAVNWKKGIFKFEEEKKGSKQCPKRKL